MTMTPARKREGQTPDNMFVEYAEPAAASSVEITMNAKGQYVYTLKLYFAPTLSPVELLAQAKAFDVQFKQQYPTPAS